MKKENFNLRKFLTENNLTKDSKILSETTNKKEKVESEPKAKK